MSGLRDGENRARMIRYGADLDILCSALEAGTFDADAADSEPTS